MIKNCLLVLFLYLSLAVSISFTDDRISVVFNSAFSESGYVPLDIDGKTIIINKERFVSVIVEEVQSVEQVYNVVRVEQSGADATSLHVHWYLRFYLNLLSANDGISFSAVINGRDYHDIICQVNVEPLYIIFSGCESNHIVFAKEYIRVDRDYVNVGGSFVVE